MNGVRRRGAGPCDRGREEKTGKRRGDAVAAVVVLNQRTEVGDDRRGDATRRARAESGGEREGGPGRQRPNRGGGRGLTGGPRPQCRTAALADKWARAA
jgi:hypothetical protein